MIEEKKIISRIERKRVPYNLKLLPETVAGLNSYLAYLADLVAREKRNEHQVTASLLFDCYIQELLESDSYKKWLARTGGSRRRGKPEEQAILSEQAEGPRTDEQKSDSEAEESMPQ